MPNSIRCIVSSVERLCEYSQCNKLHQLNTSIIKSFLYEQREKLGWSAKTFRNVRQYLSSFFKWCEQEGYIKDNPVNKIGKPKLAKRLPRFLNKEDVIQLLGYIRFCRWNNEKELLRNETIIYTLLYTGLRSSELRNLKLNDVDLASGKIIVFNGKGRKDRVIPIHPKLLGILKHYKKEFFTRPMIWFFYGLRSEHKLSENVLLKMCRKVSKESKVKFTPHMLRHTFGRLAMEADFNIYKLKEIMGHSSIDTTLVYVSASMENIKKSFDSVQLI